MVLPIRASLDTGFRETVTIAGDHVGGRPRRRRDQPEPRRPERRPGARPRDRLRGRARTCSSSRPRATTATRPRTRSTTPRPTSAPRRNGGWSIGLSVGATMPDNQLASVLDATTRASRSPRRAPARAAARSGSSRRCRPNVLTTEWDDADPVQHGAVRDAGADRRRTGAGATARARASRRRSSPPSRRSCGRRTRCSTPAQVADVLRRSATQTVGTGWNPYTGAGLVNADGRGRARARLRHDAADDLAHARSRRSAASRSTSPAPTRVDAGKTPAGGLTVGARGLDRRRRPTPRRAPWRRPRCTSSSRPRAPTWLRATVCDANHNCTQSVEGSADRARAGTAREATRSCSSASSAARTRSSRCGSRSEAAARARSPSRSSRGRARAGARSTASRSASGRP